jgi:two-component system LytT family sensor kinase
MPELKPTLRRAALLFAGWTLVGLLFAAVSYGIARSDPNSRFGLSEALKLNLVQFYLWGLFSILIFGFSRRFLVEFRPLRVRNLLLQGAALVLFAGLHQALHLATLWSISSRMRRQFPSLLDCYRAYFGFGFYIDVIIAALIVIGVHALLYYRKFRAGELEQASLKAQLAQARLAALKMQLHPHFLFNTLHSISSLVLEDPPKANSMIARLGDFLRLTLDHSDEQLVTLKEETEFLRCYLEIEQVRFGDRLTVEFQIEPGTLAAEVPHLILQPVVENAIQHAIAPRSAPGHIKVEAKRKNGVLRLEVRDSGSGLKADVDALDGQGVGLRNLRARLEQLYGRDYSFEITNRPEGGVIATIQLPFQAQEPNVLLR